MITPQELAEWFKKHAGYVYHDGDMEYFGIDGEVNLIDLAEFINQKCKDGLNGR